MKGRAQGFALAAAVMTAMAAGAAAWFSREPSGWWFVLGAWSLSILAAIPALRLLGSPAVTPLQSAPVRLPELSLVLALVAAALAVRLYDLGTIPFQIHNDEASIGLEARRFLSADRPPLFASGWYHHPNVGYAIYALLQLLWGDDLAGLRASSVTFGMISLGAAWALVRMLFGAPAALLALALLVPFHFHVHMSRTGFHYIEAAAFSMVTLALFVAGLRRASIRLCAAAGITMGIGMQGYSATHVLPIVLSVWSVWVWLFEKPRRPVVWRGLAALFLLAGVTWVPVIRHFVENPSEFQARAHEVFVFSPSNAGHVASVVGSPEKVDILQYQVQQIGRWFVDGDDHAVQYGAQFGFIDPWLVWPALVGLVLVLVVPRYRSGGVLLWLWTVTTLVIGGVMTIDPPFSPRLVGLSPILPAFAAVAIGWLVHALAARRPVQILVVSLGVLLAGASAVYNVRAYFVEYQSLQPGSRRDLLSRFLEARPEIRTVVNLSPQAEDFNYQSFQLLAPGVRGINAFPEREGVPAMLTHLERPVLLMGDTDDDLAPGTAAERGEAQHRDHRFHWAIIR